MRLGGEQALARAAKSYLQLGRLSDARRMYATALELDPRNSTARAEVRRRHAPLRPLSLRSRHAGPWGPGTDGSLRA